MRVVISAEHSSGIVSPFGCKELVFIELSLILQVFKGFWTRHLLSKVREGDSSGWCWWLVDVLLDYVHAIGDRDSWGLVIMICCGIIMLDSGDGAKGTAQRQWNTCREAITLFPKLYCRKQIYHTVILPKINELKMHCTKIICHYYI